MDPQLAGRRGSAFREAHVGASVATESRKGDAAGGNFAGDDGWPWGQDGSFFEGDPEWEQFVDHEGRPWWWRERDGLCFYEPLQGFKFRVWDIVHPDHRGLAQQFDCAVCLHIMDDPRQTPIAFTSSSRQFDGNWQKAFTLL